MEREKKEVISERDGKMEGENLEKGNRGTQYCLPTSDISFLHL